MLVILGLILLIAALFVGVVGVLTSDGAAHQLTGGFSVSEYPITGSAGTLFPYGIVVGAVAMFSLRLLPAGARGSSHRGHYASPGLKLSRRRRPTAGNDRADFADQRGIARPQTKRAREPNSDGERRRGLNPFKHRREPR